MATPTEHAFLSASSAHRWLVCTASPHFETQFPDGTSSFAEEGTLAHKFCELYGQKAFHSQEITPQEFTAEVDRLSKNELYDPEMLECASGYVEYLKTKSIELYDSAPHIAQEVKVDFSKYVPNGFGTCDCIMVGGDTLHITDYKHGKGVRVDAKGNPQMRLYALGALELYRVFYPNIKYVSMGIYQPRISRDEPSEDKLTIEELIEWGGSIVPLAQAAYNGTGTFEPGEHCRFCKGKAQCKARADKYSALADFQSLVVPTPENVEEAQRIHDACGADVTDQLLTNAQIGELLKEAEGLEQWVKDLKDYATQAILQGEVVDGWKVVEGKSMRKIADIDGLVDTLKAADYDEALLYERKPLTLTGYEKLVGKKKFAELASEFCVKPQGAPTLAPIEDKRAPFNSAITDFAGVNDNA